MEKRITATQAVRDFSEAIALGFSVATFDKRHFERIEGLKIEILH